MKNRVISMFFGGVALFVLVLLAGCGEGDETNKPAVALTSSVVASQVDSSGHSHLVTVPFVDVVAAPTLTVYQYRTSDSPGHSHVVAISSQQMSDLNSGLKLQLVSSAATTDGHTHSWVLTGGSMLYDKFCFNCHSNDNRGRAPMNVTFTATQRSNLMNPSGAPVSTAVPATPDPGYTPAPGPTVIDGAALYAANCAGCHTSLATSTVANRTAVQIRAAMNANRGGMGFLNSLTDAQLAAIAAALVK